MEDDEKEAGRLDGSFCSEISQGQRAKSRKGRTKVPTSSSSPGSRILYQESKLEPRPAKRKKMEIQYSNGSRVRQRDRTRHWSSVVSLDFESRALFFAVLLGRHCRPPDSRRERVRPMS